MGETESRTVETKYTAVDAGYGATVGRISSAFESGARQADKFRLKMGELRAETGFSTLGMLGLGAGIGAWVEKAKDAQTEFAGAQKSIASVLSTTLQFSKGTTEIERYHRSFQLASHVVEEAEETAGRFNMRLEDVSGVYRSLSLSAGQFGLSEKQVNDLMIETSATAKRFGVSGEYAAGTIARALKTGSVRGVDEFSLSLARAMGDMHKLGQAARFDHIQKALRGSMSIADEMSQGMGASIARAQMEVTAVFRDATGPVFKQIGASISSWAKHIKEVRENGRSLIDDFGGKLATAFNVLKDVSGFIKDHWVSIGAVFGTLKAIDLTKSWSGSLAAMAASRAGTGVGALAGVGAGGFAGLASSILPVVGALAAFKVGLDGVIGVIDGYLEKGRAKDEKAGFGMGSVGTMMSLLAKQREVGVLDSKTAAIGKSAVAELAKQGFINNGKLDPGAIAGAITRMGSGDREQWATKLGIRNPYMPVSQMSGDQFSKAIVAQLGGIVAQYATAAKTAATGIVDDKAVKFAKQVNNFNGGIHITQKFEDANPDAVFVRFRDDVMREVGSRTQALTAEPQGD